MGPVEGLVDWAESGEGKIRALILGPERTVGRVLDVETRNGEIKLVIGCLASRDLGRLFYTAFYSWPIPELSQM